MDHAAYEEASELFARMLAPLLQPADLIWLHDYQLIPAAQKLRALGVSHPLGFFLHVPFPHFEMLRALPVHVQILRALLDYDVVGSQTEIDRESVLGAVWGDNVSAGTTVGPSSPDTAQLQPRAMSAAPLKGAAGGP